MKVQDHIEYAMKRVHRMIANAQTAQDNEDLILVSKSELLRWMEDINKSILEMEDIYEVTEQAQESARIRTQKRCDRMIKETRKTSDDIYAASLLYMEDVMKMLYRQMNQFKKETGEAERAFEQNITDRMKRISNNHKDLKKQMQKTMDDQTYEYLLQQARSAFGPAEGEEEDPDLEEAPKTENPLPWQNANLDRPVPAPDVRMDEAAAQDNVQETVLRETGREASATVDVHYDAAYFQSEDAQVPDENYGDGVVGEKDADSGKDAD